MTHVPAQIIIGDDDDSTSTSTTLAPHSIQNLVVTTKAHQAASAVQHIRPYLKENCNIIVLCNGALAVRDELQKVLHQADDDDTPNLIVATTTHGVYQPQPSTEDDDDDDDGNTYHIEHAGLGKTFVEDRISGLGQLWDKSGLHCTSIASKEMNVLLWQKLAANCVINPLTAIYNCPNGELLMEPSVPEMMHDVLDELSHVAKQLVVTDHDDDDDDDDDDKLSTQALTMFVRQVIHDTASNKSSMWQDVLHKRRTEVDHLNGYVVAKGRSLGLECPANEDLCDRIREFKRG